MIYETLLIDRPEAGIARVTINRPDALNALNDQVFDEFADYLASVESEDEVRVIVLTGAGDKAFVAGADIKQMVTMTPAQAKARSWRGMQLYDRMRRQPQPLIAMINGYALGGGMLIAMACDVRIASRTAEFGYPEIRLGIFPGTGGTVLIDRLIGPGAARAICLLGERFPAERALALGLANEVVAPEALYEETMIRARRLAGYSPVALRELKAVLNASVERDFASAREVELEAYERVFASEDRGEGVRAFVEKRPPVFTGR